MSHRYDLSVDNRYHTYHSRTDKEQMYCIGPIHLWERGDARAGEVLKRSPLVPQKEFRHAKVRLDALSYSSAGRLH
jgi:hypothetical protein